jgi:hypothetical protein
MADGAKVARVSFVGVDLGFDWNPALPPSTTRCKHGNDDCDRCGTASRRDAKHTTINGRGKVARLKGTR